MLSANPQMSLPPRPYQFLPLHLLPQILLAPLVISTRRTFCTNIFLFALYTVITGHAIWSCRQGTTGEMYWDYTVGSTLAVSWFNTCALFLLVDPFDKYRHDQDDDGFGIAKASPCSWRRLWWVTCVTWNMRGVGWNYRVAHIPPQPTMSRWLFVFSRLVRATVYSVLSHFLDVYISQHSLVTRARAASAAASLPVPVFSSLSVPHATLVAAWAARTVAQIDTLHHIVAAACVALGVSEPKHWPDMMGNMWEAWSLRRFWGRFWHQLLRRFFVAFGLGVTRVLGLRRGSRASAYTQVCIAFAISALIHATGDVIARPGMSPLGQSVPFFLIQIVGLALEDVVGLEKFVERRGVFGKMVGYAWVSGWFCAVSSQWIQIMECGV